MSGLRKTSTNIEEKKEQEQENSTTTEAELKEQVIRLNEEVKKLKEKNDEFIVSS